MAQEHPIDDINDTELLQVQSRPGGPFKLKVKPRSQAHAALIEQVAQEAELTLD